VNACDGGRGRFGGEEKGQERLAAAVKSHLSMNSLYFSSVQNKRTFLLKKKGEKKRKEKKEKEKKKQRTIIRLVFFIRLPLSSASPGSPGNRIG